MSRSNLVTAPNFESGAGGWGTSGSANPTTVSTQGTGERPQGSAYGVFTARAAGTANAQSPRTDSVTPGQAYVASLWVYRPTSAAVRLDIDWYASDGTYLSSSSRSTTPSANAWTRISAAGTAPSSASYVRVFPAFTSVSADQLLGIDGVMLEPGTTLGTYGDGDTAGWEWTGTRHASSSREIVARSRAVGQPVERDTVTSLARSRRRTLGQAAEVDSVAPVGRVRTPRSGERDTVAAVDRTRTRAVGQAGEVDSVTPVARVRRRGVAQPGETDSVTAPARRRRRVVGLTETDTVHAVARRRRRGVEQPVEYDFVTQLAESATAVSPAAIERAVRGRDRVTHGELVVDWGDGAEDLYPLADSITVERERRGDLPETSGLIDGPVSSSLSVELGGTRAGASMPFAEELSPFRSDSPLHGRRKTLRPISVEMGLVTDEGPAAERVFTGLTRDLAIGEGDASVQLDGIDLSENLRALITLPTFAEFITHVSERGQGDPKRGWQFTVNTQWILDYCLRENGVYASPPFRDTSIIGCTGHGGLVSEVGFNGAPVSRAGVASKPTSKWTEDDNPWSMLATPEGSHGSYQEFYGFTDSRNPPVRFESGQGVGMSGWLHLGARSGSASTEYTIWELWPTRTRDPRLFVVAFGDGSIAAGLYDENAYKIMTPKVALTSAKWHFAGVHFRWVSAGTLGVTLRTRAQGSTAGTTRSFELTGARVIVTPTPFYDGYRSILMLRAHMWRSWMLLQSWISATPPATSSATAWRGEEWTSQADIGRGNNELSYLPSVVAAETWDTMKDAVGAEYGVHGRNDFGRYSFRPRTDARPDRVDHVLDVLTNLADARYSTSSDAVRNSVGLETNPKWHTGRLTTVVKAESVDQFVIPGNSTREWELDWPYGTAGYRGGTLPYHYQKDAETGTGGFDMWSNEVVHGWTYSSIGASGNYTIIDNTRSVVVTYCQIDSRRVRIRVANNGSGSVRLASGATREDAGAGEPALRIGGWPLVDVPARVTTFRNDASIAELGGRKGGGERSLPIPSSEWRQNESALSPVMTALLDALSVERPLIEDLEVLGDPRIKVDDVAELRFRDVPAPSYGTIVKTRHSLSSTGGLRTQVSVRLLPVAQTPIVQPATLAPAGWLFYIDISRWQAGIDLARVHEAGYAGCVARVGQGGGQYTKTDGTVVNHGQVDDTSWTTFRDQGIDLWGKSHFAAYWYLGNVEPLADQAARCKRLLGDTTIPVMMDWEDGSGDFNNLVNAIAAFRNAGLRVPMVYCGRGYANANAPSGSSLAGRGVSLVSARYWTNDPAGVDPREDFDSQREGFGFEEFLGVTPSANQFTQYGRVYDGMLIDVNAFPGDADALSAMFHGRS